MVVGSDGRRCRPLGRGFNLAGLGVSHQLGFVGLDLQLQAEEPGLEKLFPGWLIIPPAQPATANGVVFNEQENFLQVSTGLEKIQCPQLGRVKQLYALGPLADSHVKVGEARVSLIGKRDFDR